MDTNNIIFVPTIAHTGTWFVLRFLNKFIPNIVEVLNIFEDKVVISQPTILQCHFPVDIELDWKAFTRIQNMNRVKSLSTDAIFTLCSIFKTVIPIRDPLAAILTREARHPEHRHFFVTDGFIELATRFDNHPNILFFPIDLFDTSEERKILLTSLLNHCLIPIDENAQQIINQVSVEWKPENYTPENRFKELYNSRDRKGLSLLLGPKQAEVEYLKYRSGIIEPFLIKLGYTGRLFW